MDTEVDLYNGATNQGGDGRLFSTVRDLFTTTPKRHEATTITIAERNELQVFDRKLCSPRRIVTRGARAEGAVCEVVLHQCTPPTGVKVEGYSLNA